MIKKITFGFYIILLCCHSMTLAQIDSDFDKIQKALNAYKVVKGKFKQTKKIKNIELDLDSSGEFEFSRPLSIRWNQKDPMESTLLMTEDKIVQLNDGVVGMSIDKKENPAVFTLSAGLMSAFLGNRMVLEKEFNCKSNYKKSNKWELYLTPKSEVYKNVFKYIKVFGGQFIERVEIEELSDSSTKIIFFDQKGF